MAQEKSNKQANNIISSFSLLHIFSSFCLLFVLAVFDFANTTVLYRWTYSLIENRACSWICSGAGMAPSIQIAHLTLQLTRINPKSNPREHPPAPVLDVQKERLSRRPWYSALLWPAWRPVTGTWGSSQRRNRPIRAEMRTAGSGFWLHGGH
ncbi:hypothetical protein CI102_13654 [Trichoderma harzianum]|nr:hypothetical protein CI102_13654 [Trichoderma harzianum]